MTAVNNSKYTLRILTFPQFPVTDNTQQVALLTKTNSYPGTWKAYNLTSCERPQPQKH